MGTFSSTSPAELRLETWEARDRAVAIAASGSPSPVPFAPIADPPAVYTHVGHDAQYGAGRRNGRTVRLLILHTTESDTFTGSMSYSARRPDSVSATAHVGVNGELGYNVPEADRPYTTGRWNDESLTLEVCGRAAWTVDQWRARPSQLEGITRLLVDWCRRFNISPVWLAATQIAAGASRQSTIPQQGTERGICDHLEANRAAIALGGDPVKYSHHDIGVGLRHIVITEIIPEVARRMAPKPPTPEIPNPRPRRPDMIIFEWRKNTADYTGLVGNGTHLAHAADGDASGVYIRAGATVEPVNDVELLALIKSCKKTTPCPPRLTPAMKLAWG